MSKLDVNLLMEPDEKIIRIARPHWIVLTPIIPLIAMILLLLDYSDWHRIYEFFFNQGMSGLILFFILVAGVTVGMTEIRKSFSYWHDTRFYLTKHRLIVISGVNLLVAPLTKNLMIRTNGAVGKKRSWGNLYISGPETLSLFWKIQLPGEIKRWDGLNETNGLQLNIIGKAQPGTVIRFKSVANPHDFIGGSVLQGEADIAPI